MSPEQKKTIDRCKDMLKRAFPDLTGHIEFHIKEGSDTVKAKCMKENL
jgi:hypothetical protein